MNWNMRLFDFRPLQMNGFRPARLFPQIVSSLGLLILLLPSQPARSQAQDTPCMKDVLATKVGWNVDTTEAAKIMNGEYQNNQKLTEATNAVLQSLKKQPDNPTIKIDISMTDVAYTFQNWKEATSTSLSGRHL